MKNDIRKRAIALLSAESPFGAVSPSGTGIPWESNIIKIR